MRYLPGEGSSWVDIGKDHKLAPDIFLRHQSGQEDKIHPPGPPKIAGQSEHRIRLIYRVQRDREYKMILTVQISPFLALLTLLFDRCSIPFAISLAILILSPLVKHISGWFAFT